MTRFGVAEEYKVTVVIIINKHRIAKCIDVKTRMAIDCSAEPLTPNPHPRNFDYKIITKIRALHGRSNENRPLVVVRPWKNWTNMQ